MPGISSGRLVAALTVGAVGAASVVAIGTAARASGPTAVWLASAVVLGGVVAAGAGVAGLGPRPGWAVPGTFVLAVVVAVWTFLGADRIAALIRHVVTLLGWVPPVGAALPAVGAGLATGSAVAVLVLLPHALSTPDTAPASQPTPPPSAAPAARKAPAPVAIPGVPEILEWPPRRASRAGQEGFASE